jgi:DNA-directed RNA polymerase specialized sigma subunit
MTLEEIQDLLKKDKNFIYSKRFDYSIEKLLERYPEGAPLKTIAQVLLITEEEVEKLTKDAIMSLRKKMKVDVD